MPYRPRHSTRSWMSWNDECRLIDRAVSAQLRVR